MYAFIYVQCVYTCTCTCIYINFVSWIKDTSIIGQLHVVDIVWILNCYDTFYQNLSVTELNR